MANYRYVARTIGGERVTGLLEAASEAAVLRALDDKKLLPVQLTQQADKNSSNRPALLGGGRIRARDVGLLYGQLADLLGAGVPLLRAVATLGRTTSNPKLLPILRDVQEQISQGKSLAEAMAMHPKVFTSLHCAMVRAGERGGFVEDVLTNLAVFIDRQDDLRSKVRGAMIYPAILVFVGVTLMLVALVVMVPNFKPMFQGFPLPLPTRVLFALSSVLVDYWMISLVMMVFATMTIWMITRSAIGQELWERNRMKIPFLGPTMRMVSITRLCRILGTMLANGVPILQALSISKDAAGSLVLCECIEQAADNVRRGQPLTQPLRESGLFPKQIVEMIAVAEESNQLEQVLSQIADTVERRTTREVDNAVRLIEPAILVTVAGCIAFLAVGLLYPIFTMARTLR